MSTVEGGRIGAIDFSRFRICRVFQQPARRSHKATFSEEYKMVGEIQCTLNISMVNPLKLRGRLFAELAAR